MNPDTYAFVAECPQCKTVRGVNSSQAQVKTGQRIEVFAVACGHTWTLTLTREDLYNSLVNARGSGKWLK
jgi:hypothetical protein